MHKFKVGDVVEFIDGPTWTNERVRHLIGTQGTITGIEPTGKGMSTLREYWPHARWYEVTSPVHTGPIQCIEDLLRKIEPKGDDLENETDTPNKVVSWDKVPWQPTRVNV